MKHDAFDHPKMKGLARRLGIPLYAANGIVARLWRFTSKSSPAGDVGRWENWQIADACCWESDDQSADRLVSALTAEEFIDESVEHRLTIHDWPDHCEDAVHLRLARDVKYFADGSQPKLSRLNNKEREELQAKYDVSPCAHKNAQDTHGNARGAHGNALPSHAKPCQAITPHSPPPDGGGACELSPSEIASKLADRFHADWRQSPPSPSEVAKLAEIVEQHGEPITTEAMRRLPTKLRREFPGMKHLAGAWKSINEIIDAVKREQAKAEKQATEAAKRAATEAANLAEQRRKREFRDKWKPQWEAATEDVRDRIRQRVPGWRNLPAEWVLEQCLEIFAGQQNENTIAPTEAHSAAIRGKREDCIA